MSGYKEIEIMKNRYILTAFGQDRPGIVAEVTEIFYGHDCILEDSEMTKLSDEFAVIFLFSSEDKDIEDKLSLDCRRLEREKGVSAFFRHLGSEVHIEEKSGKTHRLHMEGLDKGGLLYRVSSFLAEKDINIIHLHSHRDFSPLSGTALYTMDMEILLPQEIDFDEFRRGLRQVGNSLHVDIQLE